MNSARRPLTLLLLVMLSACSGISDPRPEPQRKSEYYLEHGVSAFENSDFVTASSFLHKALAHYRSIDDTTGILLSRINLAETALAAGNFAAADKHIHAAEQISRKQDYREFQPRLALLRSQIHWRQHEAEKSLQLLAPLLPSFDEAQRSNRKPDLLMLGATTLRTDIAFSRDDDNNQEARLWLRRLSLMLPATEGKTQLHQARLLRFEAQLALFENNSSKALTKLDEALQLYRNAASRPATAATLTELALLYVGMEKWSEAEEHLQRALYIRLWIMDREGAKEVLNHLQTLYRQTGNDSGVTLTGEQIEEINSYRAQSAND